MANLKALNDAELLLSTDKAVDVEKEAVRNTTRHFHEIYLRRSYLPGYATMFELLTKRYGFCNGSAQLRIGAIDLIRQVPAAQEKIESGELSMTAAANIRTFLNAEKNAERPYSLNAKIELVDACLGKSTREVQKEFVRRNPEFELRETVRYTSESRVRIDVSISEATLNKLNELRDLLAHVNPNISLGQLIERLAEDGVEKYSPQRKAARAERRRERKAIEDAIVQASSGAKDEKLVGEEPCGDGSPLHAHEVAAHKAAERPEVLHAHEVKPRKGTRHIPAHEKHQVANDGRGCAFVDEKTGRRCGSTKFLQLDHIVPFAKGGANTADNLRWMCGVHNRWRSDYESGPRSSFVKEALAHYH